jgi:hypothetical protein
MPVFSLLTEFVRSVLFWDIIYRIAVIPAITDFWDNYLSERQGSGNALGVLPGFVWPLMEPTSCPETSVMNYHNTLRNMPG